VTGSGCREYSGSGGGGNPAPFQPSRLLPKSHGHFSKLRTPAGVAQLWDEYVARTVQLDLKPTREAFLFSYAADNSRPCNPDGITHRFGRMCKRLGIDCHLHSLRHYSATELITAGVDVRTVAGRLGHGGGGTTTLRVYSAWVPESDKRAASLLAGRMPRPGKRNTG
jgi:integrase